MESFSFPDLSACRRGRMGASAFPDLYGRRNVQMRACNEIHMKFFHFL